MQRAAVGERAINTSSDATEVGGHGACVGESVARRQAQIACGGLYALSRACGGTDRACVSGKRHVACGSNSGCGQGQVVRGVQTQGGAGINRGAGRADREAVKRAG